LASKDGRQAITTAVYRVILNSALLLDTLPTLTMIGHVGACCGTGTTIFVFDREIGVTNVPLKVTALDPCSAPNPEPVIVTAVPAGPLAGLTFWIASAGPVWAKLTTPPKHTTKRVAGTKADALPYSEFILAGPFDKLALNAVPSG
jgi:hypothetical protein